MRKAAAAVLLSIALTPAVVQAQNTATVGVSATILANVVVTSLTNLEFGSIIPGSGTTVSTGAAAPAGQQLGELQIIHNANVTVTTSVPANLVGPGGNLPVTFVCAYATTSQGTISGSETACNTLPQRNVLLPGVDETTFVQVGGSLAAATAEAGRLRRARVHRCLRRRRRLEPLPLGDRLPRRASSFCR